MKKELKQLYRTLRRYKEDIVSYDVIKDARKRFPDLSDQTGPYFIIGMPGSLHVVQLCLKFIPKYVNVVFVANGLEEWEHGWAREHLKVRSIITINKTITHGNVMDLLFEKYPYPFGILDYDCFVLNPSYFQQMQNLDPSSMLNAIFVTTNPILKLEIPETFMLYFNTPIINELKHKYRASSNITNFILLSKESRNQLSKIRIDQNHYPEDYKDYFDSLRLLISLGLADGYKCNFIARFPPISKSSSEVFHVGGVSVPKLPRNKWGTRGFYLWHSSLEANLDGELRKRYWEKYGRFDKKEILAINPKFTEKIGMEFFSFIDNIVDFNSSNL
jgi:hypothetical protein